MLDELIRLVDRHGNILNLSIEYGKVTDWTIDIEHRICIGKYEPPLENNKIIEESNTGDSSDEMANG